MQSREVSGINQKVNISMGSSIKARPNLEIDWLLQKQQHNLFVKLPSLGK